MSAAQFPGVVKAVRSRYFDVMFADGSRAVVPLPRGRLIQAGDAVTISIDDSPLRRLFISVLLPVFFTLLLFSIFYLGTGNVVLSGFMALIVLGPYIACIWLLKDSLSRTVKLF